MLKHILKSASIVLSATIFSTILGYIFKVIIARTNQELYGLYSLTNSIILFLVPIVLLGLNIGLLKYLGHSLGKNDNEKSNLAISTAFKIVIPLSLITSLVLFFFSDLISSFFKTDISLALKLFSPMLFILSISSLFFSILTSNKKIKELAFSRNIIQSAFELGTLLIFVLIGLNIKGIASTLIISNLIMLFFLYGYSKNSFKFEKGLDKGLISFSLSAFFIFIISDLLNRIDTILLGHFSTLKEVALYNVATPTAQIVLMLSMALLSVFLPSISEKYARKESIKQEYKKTFHWILLSTIPLSVLLIFFSQKMIEIFFGVKYYLSAIPLSILAFSLLFFSLSRPSFNVLLMLKKTKILLKLSILVVIINIILNLILIPLSIKHYQHGIYGASIATGISFIIMSILTLFYAKKYSKLELFDKTAWKIILSGILASIPLIVIKIIVKNQNLFEVIVYLLIFVILYIALLFALKCFDKEDRKIWELIEKKLKLS